MGKFTGTHKKGEEAVTYNYAEAMERIPKLLQDKINLELVDAELSKNNDNHDKDFKNCLLVADENEKRILNSFLKKFITSTGYKTFIKAKGGLMGFLTGKTNFNDISVSSGMASIYSQVNDIDGFLELFDQYDEKYIEKEEKKQIAAKDKAAGIEVEEIVGESLLDTDGEIDFYYVQKLMAANPKDMGLYVSLFGNEAEDMANQEVYNLLSLDLKTYKNEMEKLHDILTDNDCLFKFKDGDITKEDMDAVKSSFKNLEEKDRKDITYALTKIDSCVTEYKKSMNAFEDKLFSLMESSADKTWFGHNSKESGEMYKNLKEINDNWNDSKAWERLKASAENYLEHKCIDKDTVNENSYEKIVAANEILRFCDHHNLGIGNVAIDDRFTADDVHVNSILQKYQIKHEISLKGEHEKTSYNGLLKEQIGKRKTEKKAADKAKAAKEKSIKEKTAKEISKGKH